MKTLIRITALILSLVLTCCLFASCGKDKGETENTSTHEAIPYKDMKIGVLFTDNAVQTADSYFHKTGIESALSELIDTKTQLIFKYNITDVSFEESASFVIETTAIAKTEEKTTEKEPETFLDDDGNPVVEAVPIAEKDPPETAVQAVSSLLSDGCNIIIATDKIYDSFTQYLAKQKKDIIFLQYDGGAKDINNLQSYSADLYEAFYLAGAVAGSVSKSGKIGFFAGELGDTEKKNINAFALGTKESNEKATVTLRASKVAFDLGLERSLPAELLGTDGCDFLMQSSFTALPQTVAENANGEFKHEGVPCIGYGYDMSADAQKMNVCSIIIDYGVYFKQVFTSINDGKFTNASFTANVENGCLYLSEFRTQKDSLDKIISVQKQKFTGDTDIFSGFTPSDNGFSSNVVVK